MALKRTSMVSGGSGIGETSCYRLARDGKAIAALDLNAANAEKVAQGIRAAGGEAIAVAGYITAQLLGVNGGTAV